MYHKVLWSNGLETIGHNCIVIKGLDVFIQQLKDQGMEIVEVTEIPTKSESRDIQK